MKAFLKKHDVLIDCLLFVAVMVGFFWLIVTPVAAADLIVTSADDPLSLFDLLSALVGGDKAAQWLSLIGLVCYLFTHIIAWLPPEWVAKLPTWLIKFIAYLAGNYRGTKNELVNTVKRTR